MPNAFFSCIAVVRAAIAELQPEIAVMLGEFDGRLHDIRGVVLQDEPTAVDGPVVYRATLSIWAMRKAMPTAGVPADISDTGGTFC